MPEIYLSGKAQRAEQIFVNRPDLLAQYRRYSNISDDILLPNQPYLMTCAPGDINTLQAFKRFSHPELQRLQQISAEYDEQTLALAYVTEEQIKPVIQLLDQHGTTAAGALVGATNSKYSVFQRSIIRYQQALLDLHQASQAKAQAQGARTKGAHNSIIAAKEAHARLMHAEMEQRFQQQLQRYRANLGSSAKRSALLSADRGVNVARSGRNNQRTGQTLHFANSQQVATVQRFVSSTNMIGRGILVLDFGLRTEKVYNAKDSWREGVTQYSGFGASAGMGALVASGTKSIGMALMLSPAGWVVLIGAAVVVGFMAVSWLDNKTQDVSGRFYDSARMRL
ncbi:hypothetical protein [Rheinheimera salexigens]|uniref:Uncharacterized protein n=1 Tax=Rheinheimera salexigens TaxID=1628148 RepID=A0A1E7Q3Z4_9GAMM|nr:hypothetical protein [Rheinheimera salexigens]OEY68859.1 hypothetical protein BI198_04230 [Rheinheimera salexigens]